MGQLQWRPGPVGDDNEDAEQLALVEFDDTLSNAVVRVLTLNSGHRNTIAALNASIISGEPRWSPNGQRLAFAGFAEGSGNWINLAEIDSNGTLRGAFHVIAPTDEGVDYSRHITFLDSSSRNDQRRLRPGSL